ncbi:unnamed protein product, partial [marine sediment metagenome]
MAIKYVYKVVNGIGLSPRLRVNNEVLRRRINSGGTFEADFDFFELNPKVIEGSDVEFITTRGYGTDEEERNAQTYNEFRRKPTAQPEVIIKDEPVEVIKKGDDGKPVPKLKENIIAEVIKDDVKISKIVKKEEKKD